MIRFLQISDIHFTDQAGNDDEYAQMKCKFLEDIAKCHRVIGRIDHVLICGDIAFSGLDSQYKEARLFIDSICEQTECEKGDVLMVPGNHDKKWEVYQKTRSMMKDQLLKGKNIDQLLKSKVKEPMAVGILYAPFKQYYKLAADHFCISDIALKAAAFPESDQEKEGIPRFEPGDSMYWTEQLGELNGYSLAIHGSNTSLLSDKDDGESWNLSDEKHLQVLPLQAYNVTSKEDEIHILMLHHPITEIDKGSLIEKDIDGRFQLQLYGHIHKQSSMSDGTIKIYSGALQPEDQDDKEYFPVYNVIQVDVIEENGIPRLKVDIFSRKWNGTDFEEYAEETKTGTEALKVDLPHNDSWEKTMERFRSGAPITDHRCSEAISPHAVKNAFLKSEKAGRIIKEMYGDQFDAIRQNRFKYLAFLKQVESDSRFVDLNNRLSNDE